MGTGGKERGEGEGLDMDHLMYLKNDKCYKPETLGGDRGILQSLKKKI